MAAGADTIVRRTADAFRRRGFQVTLRRVSYLNQVAPNPPILTDPVLAGAAAAGDSLIAIRASQADGRILAGDTLTIGSNPAIAVATTVSARTLGFDPASPVVPGFNAVQLAAPLSLSAADGAPIVAAWSADQPVWIAESSYSVTEASDEIQVGDVAILIAAYGVARPQLIDQLIVDGLTRSIVSVGRRVVRGVTAVWVVQAR